MAKADHSKLTDEALVDIIVDGNTDAYAELLDRYEAKLLRYVVFLIHDASLAHDVVQDTFIKAYRNLRSYNAAYKFSSWIYRIAHNEAMNTVKKNKYTNDIDVDTVPELSYDPKPAEAIDKALLQGHVQECVRQLSAKYRDVIQLIYFEGMKYDEAGDVLHIPTSTIGVRLSRAKAELRKICEQKGVKR